MNFIALSASITQSKGWDGSRSQRQRVTVQLKGATTAKQSHPNHSKQQQKAKATSPA